MAIGKYELSKRIATKAQLTHKQAAEVFGATLSAIQEALEGGDDVRLVGFGTFRVQTMPQHKAINPNTQEPIIVPARPRVRFKAHTALAASVNKE
jgi:DNA-binding protein HU-beta